MTKKQDDLHSNMHYNPRIVNLIDGYLLDQAHILKIGAKTGRDLAKLGKHYQVTGSVFSSADVDILQAKHPNLTIKKIDIHAPVIENNYDCIYSNKILALLSPSELASFLTIQANHLNEDGMILITLPYNDNERAAAHHNKKYRRYTKEKISQLIPKSLRIDLLDTYFDQAPDDSLLIVLKKRS